jgi:hypothetical protein
MPFAGVGGTSIRGGYLIDNSLRFNQSDDPSLIRTPASVSNRRTFTWSGWVKRSADFGTRQLLFGADNSADSNASYIRFTDGEQIQIYLDNNNSTGGQLITNALFRDVSAWYHIVWVVDTTNATADDRIKLYVNGIQVTSFISRTNPSLNFECDGINQTEPHYVGSDTTGVANDYALDGYLAETHFIDGTALDATSFGEFDEDSGIWKPIRYSGSYGTNGFYLDFENSGSLGADQSGNGNNFTPTNLASTDQTTDTPTNNFATLNSVERIQTTPSEGNCQFNGAAVSLDSMRGTIGMPTGKWYWEVKVIAIGVGGNIGIATNDSALSAGGTLTGVLQQYSGFKSINSWSNDGSYGGFTTGDIIGVALDMDSGSIEFYKNGSSQGVAYASLDTSLTFFPFVQGSTSLQYGVNFGNPSFSISSGNSDGNGYGNFEYAPPSGYLALCTQNLATELSPTIDDGSQYFNTVLWTGDGSNPRSLTGVGFQPDWLWTKARNAAFGHNVYDSSRGNDGTAYYRLETQDTASEIAQPPAGHVTSLDSDGFSVTNGSSSDNIVNNTGTTYVAWNWLVNGGSTSSNTDGSITSTVQANTTAGFSIVLYTGNATAGATIGHGLGVKPDMIIVKPRNNTANWLILHKAYEGTSAENMRFTTMALASADSQASSGWYRTAPTSSVFYVGNGVAGDYTSSTNQSGANHVAYCFAEIEGYSKFGSYTGNGSTDGPFIYTGFRPAFVLSKGLFTKDWTMVDNKRNTYNVVTKELFPNQSYAETTNDRLDFVSNGFKVTSSGAQWNNSGSTYIYMAFAESPFVTSTGIPVVAR